MTCGVSTPPQLTIPSAASRRDAHRLPHRLSPCHPTLIPPPVAPASDVHAAVCCPGVRRSCRRLLPRRPALKTPSLAPVPGVLDTVPKCRHHTPRRRRSRHRPRTPTPTVPSSTPDCPSRHPPLNDVQCRWRIGFRSDVHFGRKRAPGNAPTRSRVHFERKRAFKSEQNARAKREASGGHSNPLKLHTQV